MKQNIQRNKGIKMTVDVKELILTIVRPLVNHPNLIELTVEETQSFLEYNLKMAPEDMGHIIGKQGRIIKAIRTIIYSVPINGTKKIRLNIISTDN